MANGDRDAREVLRAHMEAERAADVGRTMSLVSADPVWVIHPVYEVSGRGAIEEMYRRSLPAPGHRELGDETVRAIDDPDVTTWSGRLCLVEYPRRPDRYPLHRGLVLVAEVDQEGVSAERAYCLDPAAVTMVRTFYGPDFVHIPGVRALAPEQATG